MFTTEFKAFNVCKLLQPFLTHNFFTKEELLYEILKRLNTKFNLNIFAFLNVHFTKINKERKTNI